jgi:hypothetical protein
MSAGRPAPPPARTIRQPRRKLVETDRVWVSRNPDSPLPGFGIPVLPPRRILASLVAYGNGPRSVGFFAFPFALDDDGTGLPLLPLWMVFWRGPRAPSPWPMPVVAEGRTSCKRASLLYVGNPVACKTQPCRDGPRDDYPTSLLYSSCVPIHTHSTPPLILWPKAR